MKAGLDRPTYLAQSLGTTSRVFRISAEVDIKKRHLRLYLASLSIRMRVSTGDRNFFSSECASSFSK